ncbi:alanine racemase [Aquirhabdus parva]|uniref:Alanine racemase n=1 Tax=Aquirhabdus parva TaxID=2283318 RepID=A0A345PBN2_9GAMM|nr:alanine racemase [Aquirhabdus parva]AXI04691.1 alanine racemase [Aquirhabdus parva]
MMSDYFKCLNAALKRANFALPTLIIDQARLDANLARVQRMLPAMLQSRIVVKSLCAMELLQYISQALDCQRFMIFHLPHIRKVIHLFPESDILLGKPMPIKAVQAFYAQHQALDTVRIQWLVDTMERLQQYLALAQAQNLKLEINIEIDVGLHRGGIKDIAPFKALLALIQAHPEHLALSGLMGYDAHVSKIPSFIQSIAQGYAESQQHYQHYIDAIQQDFPKLYHQNLCFNGSGSPTFSLHTEHSVCNDLSFGSMLLKPKDFDIPSLDGFQSALWIAAPVLKKLPSTQIPGLTLLDRLPSFQDALFIYGGKWMADYVYPQGAHANRLFGRSSNQDLVNVPKSAQIQVDDFVFLQPTQSESIISQFEQVWLYDGIGFTPWHTFI